MAQVVKHLTTTFNGAGGQTPKATSLPQQRNKNSDKGVQYNSSTREGREKIAHAAFNLRGTLELDYNTTDTLEYIDEFYFLIRDKRDADGYVMKAMCQYRCDAEDYGLDENGVDNYAIREVQGEYDYDQKEKHGIVRMYRGATMPLKDTLNVYQNGRIEPTNVNLTNIENALRVAYHEDGHGRGFDTERTNANGTHANAEFFGLRAALKYRKLRVEMGGGN